MQIGKLADRFGLNPKTIRYYEEIGLLPRPRRTASGYRQYDETALAQLEFIQRAKLVGLSLEDIREVLAIGERGDQPCDRVLSLIDAKLAHIDRRIRELKGLQEQLTALREQWSEEANYRSETTCLCPIIEEQASIATRPYAGRTPDLARLHGQDIATG